MPFVTVTEIQVCQILTHYISKDEQLLLVLNVVIEDDGFIDFRCIGKVLDVLLPDIDKSYIQIVFSVRYMLVTIELLKFLAILWRFFPYRI